jgi:phage-related protein
MKVIQSEYVKGFIENLQNKTKSRVRKNIDILINYGHMIRMPFSKNILPKIFELRIIGQENIRLIYTFHNDMAIIFHVFIKKTEQIDTREVNIIKDKYKALQL